MVASRNTKIFFNLIFKFNNFIKFEIKNQLYFNKSKMELTQYTKSINDVFDIEYEDLEFVSEGVKIFVR